MKLTPHCHILLVLCCDESCISRLVREKCVRLIIVLRILRTFNMTLESAMMKLTTKRAPRLRARDALREALRETQSPALYASGVLLETPKLMVALKAARPTTALENWIVRALQLRGKNLTHSRCVLLYLSPHSVCVTKKSDATAYNFYNQQISPSVSALIRTRKNGSCLVYWGACSWPTLFFCGCGLYGFWLCFFRLGSLSGVGLFF